MATVNAFAISTAKHSRVHRERIFATAMLSWWRRTRAGIPASFLAALALAAGFFGFVAWDQSHWWRIRDDYAFGWLVPLFVAFVVHSRWAEIRAQLTRCAAAGSPRMSGVAAGVLVVTLTATLLLGLGFFLLGAFYRAGVGVSQPGTLALTLGAVGVVTPLLFWNAPAAPSPVRAAWWEDARLRLGACFVFPVLVWLISAPLVSAMESRLNVFLLERVVRIVEWVFEKLATPLQREGSVLVLPKGQVGVAEACSGIRSLTGCIFAGACAGACFVECAWRKITLLVAAVGFALVANLLRSLFLTEWAYHHGPRAIEGTVHDVAGYAVLGLTVVCLLGFVWLLNRIPWPARAAPAGVRSDAHQAAVGGPGGS